MFIDNKRHKGNSREKVWKAKHAKDLKYKTENSLNGKAKTVLDQPISFNSYQLQKALIKTASLIIKKKYEETR